MAVDPLIHVGRIEVQACAPLDVWDPALGDQAPNVTDRHAETGGDCVDAEKTERGRRVLRRAVLLVWRGHAELMGVD